MHIAERGPLIPAGFLRQDVSDKQQYGGIHMITAGDFRKGVTIEWEGGVWTIVDFQHVKPGKGAAFVRTKLKNVMTGAVVERSFNPTDKQPRATIETKEMQYVYNDGEFYYVGEAWYTP